MFPFNSTIMNSPAAAGSLVRRGTVPFKGSRDDTRVCRMLPTVDVLVVPERGVVAVLWVSLAPPEEPPYTGCSDENDGSYYPADDRSGGGASAASRDVIPTN